MISGAFSENLFFYIIFAHSEKLPPAILVCFNNYSIKRNEKTPIYHRSTMVGTAFLPAITR